MNESLKWGEVKSTLRYQQYNPTLLHELANAVLIRHSPALIKLLTHLPVIWSTSVICRTEFVLQLCPFNFLLVGQQSFILKKYYRVETGKPCRTLSLAANIAARSPLKTLCTVLCRALYSLTPSRPDILKTFSLSINSFFYSTSLHTC